VLLATLLETVATTPRGAMTLETKAPLLVPVVLDEREGAKRGVPLKRIVLLPLTVSWPQEITGITGLPVKPREKSSVVAPELPSVNAPTVAVTLVAAVTPTLRRQPP